MLASSGPGPFGFADRKMGLPWVDAVDVSLRAVGVSGCILQCRPGDTVNVAELFKGPCNRSG